MGVIFEKINTPIFVNEIVVQTYFTFLLIIVFATLPQINMQDSTQIFY